jgi:hypothetical protein
MDKATLEDKISDAIEEAVRDYDHPQAVNPVGDAVDVIMAAVDEYLAGGT